MIRQTFDGDIFLRRSGDSSALTILYVHGLGESGLCFERLITDTRVERWHHLVPDLPGYGKTPWPQQPLPLKQQADLLAEWLDRRVPEPVVVLGHSMGGVVGLLLAERHPQKVRAFFNVEGNVSLEDCNFSRKIAAFQLADFLAGGFEEVVGGIYRGGLEDPALRTYYPSMRFCDPRQLHRNAGELVEISSREDLAVRQAALAVPNTYVLGRPGGTGEHSQALLSAAGVPWHAIEGAGHWPFLDQQSAFVGELVRFLDQLR